MSIYRKDFPILKTKIKGQPLIYLDNGATTQKPKTVIDAVTNYYQRDNANIHRGLHDLSQRSTEAYDKTREKVRRLISAGSTNEIIFTTGSTMGINFVAYTWATQNLKAGDEIILSIMEHHANIVPWQELAKRKRLKISFIPITPDHDLDYATLNKMVSKKTKLISILHISNVLGTIVDVDKIVRTAKKVKAKVLLDAAQSITHERIDVQKMDIDFMVFSGHKMYAPTGTGVLYIKEEIAKDMPPFMTGGDMIMSVTKKGATYQPPPQRFEAGTQHITGVIGLGVAIDYLMTKGVTKIKKFEHEITNYGYKKLKAIKGLTLYGPRKRSSLLSFNLDGIHPHDIAEILNRSGIAIRSGNHCAMPLHQELGLAATARASFACYNTKAEINALVRGIKQVQKIFK